MPLLERANQPTLHYTIDDCADPWRNAPALVLQHGYARSSKFWYAWVPHLARDYKVLRIDLRGHGESLRDFDPATGSMLDAYVGDLCDVLDHLGVGAVHYCGESFGGVLGMVLAARNRSGRTLTLVASPVYQNANAAYSAGFPTREEALRTLGTRKWAEAIYGAPDFFPPGTDPRLRERYVGEIAKNDVEVLCGSLRPREARQRKRVSAPHRGARAGAVSDCGSAHELRTGGVAAFGHSGFQVDSHADVLACRAHYRAR